MGDPYNGRALYYGGYYGGYYGSPAYPVGSYVPYDNRVIHRTRLKYGFASRAFACRAHRVYHSHWVPARQT